MRCSGFILLYFKTFIIFAFAHKLKHKGKPLRRVFRNKLDSGIQFRWAHA